MKFSTEQLDAMLVELDREIKSKEDWQAQARNKQHSSHNVSFDKRIKVFKDIRELVRQQRQDQQMTGMSGKRIE